MAYEMMVTFNDVMNTYCSNHKVANKRDVKKAYQYAALKHEGVTRGSGEPYIYHPLRVAKMLAEWGFESDVIVASFLHDVVEDCDTPIEEIEETFGTSVAKIVDAVTALSDRDFSDQELTKAEKDRIRDAHLQKKINDKALYVKIADRIDNLSTMSGVREEKRIPKAEHTREILIPIAKMEGAFYYIDILEELCFKIEHPGMYEEIERQYDELIKNNKRKSQETLDMFSTVFDSQKNYEGKKIEKYHRLLRNLVITPRSFISVFRQISHDADNIKDEANLLISKERTPLYDLTLVVSNEVEDEFSDISTYDIFFEYYEKVLSDKGIDLVTYGWTTYKDITYFVVADEMDNLYRFFIRTENSYHRYMFGNIIDENHVLSISDVNEFEPRDTYNEKIKVFRKDGTALMIEKGATVLDFAFHIHSELGYHFDYATLDDSMTRLPNYTRLNDGDRITIYTNEEKEPSISWFKHVKTSKGISLLIHHFQEKEKDKNEENDAKDE